MNEVVSVVVLTVAVVLLLWGVLEVISIDSGTVRLVESGRSD